MQWQALWELLEEFCLRKSALSFICVIELLTMVDCGTSLSETVPRCRRQRGEYGGITGLSMNSQCMRFLLHCMILGSELGSVKTGLGYTSSHYLKTNRYSRMGLAPQKDTARYRVRFFWVTNECAREPRIGENLLLNNKRNPGKPGLLYSERVTGIEPAPSAWKAEVLPLNYIRVRIDIT